MTADPATAEEKHPLGELQAKVDEHTRAIQQLQDQLRAIREMIEDSKFH